MEGLIGFIVIAGIVYFLITFFGKQQIKTEALNLIKSVEGVYSEPNSFYKNRSNVEYFATERLLGYLKGIDKNRIPILLSLIKKEPARKEVIEIIRRSLNIIYKLSDKLGTPINNLDKAYYLVKVEAYKNFNDIDFWGSEQEKDRYIRLWNEVNDMRLSLPL